MINNHICVGCDKYEVCKIADIIAKFSDDAKKPLGVDITINSCENFSSVDKCSVADKLEETDD